METKLQQFTVLTCILGLSFHGAFSSTRFYNSFEFNGGLLYEYNATEECIKLEVDITMHPSSIKTDDCIIVYNTSDCTIYSYKMDPGDYPDLRKVGHRYEKVLYKNIASFQKCSESYGGLQTHVTFYTMPDFSFILLDYQNVKEDMAIPLLFTVGSFDSHGNCVKIQMKSETPEWNGSIMVQGGISDFSCNPRSFGTIFFYTVGPCNHYTFNSTVVKFTVSEDKSGGQIKQTALSMGTTTTFINDGLATVSQEYGASKTITEVSEVSLVDSVTVFSSWGVKVGIEAEYSAKIPFIAHTSAKASLSAAYSLQENASRTASKSVRHEESTVYSVNQKIEIEPCTRYKVGSSVKMAKGFPMIYGIEFEVTGMDGNRRVSTSEIRGKLGSLNFVGDKDDYTVIARDEGKMVVDFGIESEISGSGEIIEGCRNNTKKVGEKFERVEGYRCVKLDVLETLLILVVFGLIVLAFKGFKMCKSRGRNHVDGYEKP